VREQENGVFDFERDDAERTIVMDSKRETKKGDATQRKPGKKAIYLFVDRKM